MKRDINYVCEVFEKLEGILGYEKIVDELKQYMNVDELAEFTEHLISMYDCEEILED